MLDIDLGFYQWRIGRSYRLARIDAPEMNTPAGVAAKDALSGFLASKSLQVQTSKADNFGRFIVELFADNVNVSDYLVASGFAVYRSY